MTEAVRIGICGGTFDPFHRGHLDPLRRVFASMEWSRVLYVPAWRQPFKQGRESVSGYHRFAMVALAIDGDERFAVTPLELERGGISYTVDTLEELRLRLPETSFDWIIGDDNLAMLPEWRSLGRILELANFVVLTRDDKAAPLPSALAARVCPAERRGAAGSIVFARNETVPVSSTEIRRRLAAGENIEEFVDQRVARYIGNQGLYGARSGQLRIEN